MNWLRQLDLRREPGWIGGVAAGIATRLGIDPLIVRGILVVVAVLGGPAILLYAVAWLLIPDHNDSIHLENFFRKKFERAHAAIAALLLLSMLPTTQGFWQIGSFVAGPASWGAELGRALWTVLLITGLVALVLWIVRLARSPRASANGDPIAVPATTDADPTTIPHPHENSADPATASAEQVNATVSAPLLPEQPSSEASDEEVAAWREQREIWKAQNAQWKSQQEIEAKEVRRQRAAELREQSRVAAALAAERRRERRRLNPRLSIGVMAIVSGIALLAGGIAAFSAPSGSATVAAATGLSVAALVFGAAIVIGGALRHRSAFLGFVAGVTVLAAAVAFALPANRTLLAASAELGEGRSAQLIGYAYLNTNDRNDAVTSSDLWQGVGEVSVFVDQGTAVTVEVRSPSSSVCIAELQSSENSEGFTGIWDCIEPTTRTDEFNQWTVTVGDPAVTPSKTIHVWQQTGQVEIFNDNPVAADKLED